MLIYDITVKDADGREISLLDYSGKVLLIVNTATGCGFTPQYEGLQKLYDKTKSAVLRYSTSRAISLEIKRRKVTKKSGNFVPSITVRLFRGFRKSTSTEKTKVRFLLFSKNKAAELSAVI